MPAHGAAYTITGSGFGSKSATNQVWDDCTGSDPATLWDVRKPDGVGSGATYGIDYRAARGGAAMPHSRISQYICGAHEPRTDANNGQNVYVAKDFTRPTFPYYSYWHWYATLDSSWAFDAGGPDNHKWYGFSTGNGSIYNLPNNWYIEFKGGTDFESSSSDAQWHTNDDAAGTGLSLGGSFSVFGGAQTNPVGNWVKRELLIKWQSDTTGFLKGWADNVQMFNETGKTDGYAGTTRCEGIEGYAGNGGVNNWRYFADIGYLRGDHIGRFLLTNNATYTSSTIIEYQSYTSWSATSVNIIVNGGKLSNGTVHLHYRDEVNGHQYLGTFNLGADAPVSRQNVRLWFQMP